MATASAPLDTAPPESVAPRVVLLLPLAFLVHLAEEWFGGFVEWTSTVLGNGVSAERFILINATGFVLFTLGVLAALRSSRMAWFGTSLAALFGLNGVVHALATVGLGRYSPGTITGLLLFLPLSAVVLRSSAARMSRGTIARAVVFGVLLHAVVTAIAFL